MIPPKSSKPKLCARPRSDSDDERLVKRIPVKTDKNVDKILFPLPPVVPVVYWERPSNCADIFCKDDLMKYVRWPIKTDVVCFQCCHAFDGVPVPCLIHMTLVGKYTNVKVTFDRGNVQNLTI